MALRELSIDPDISEYDHLTATYEGILERLFPTLRWRVLCYASLVREQQIEPYARPPAWVVIEAKYKHIPGCQSIKIDLSFFNHVSTPEALLLVIGGRLKRDIADPFPPMTV